MPARIAALGIQPAQVGMSTALSPEVTDRLGELVSTAVAPGGLGNDVVRAPHALPA